MGTIDESSKWNSPILLVPKMDESVCIYLKFDVYPIPCLDDLLDQLGVAHFYSFMDFSKGYWQNL